jgi:hypothetical protein
LAQAVAGLFVIGSYLVVERKKRLGWQAGRTDDAFQSLRR